MLTKYSTTTSLGRHRYQTAIGIKPVNYLDGNIWKHIINNWINSGIGDKPHMVTTAPFMVGVNPNGGRRIHPTREQDVWFEISGAKINQAGSWNIVQLGTPTSRIDNRITWNRTNFNAYMDMGGHFIKLGYLLKGGFLPPNNQFAFEVATHGLTRSGCVFSKDGIPVMRLRSPIAYDHDNPEDIRQIAHEITRIDSKWHAVFTLPNLAGMSKPVIDPTLELQPGSPAGKDTMVISGGNSSNNFGSLITFLRPNVTCSGIIEFDASSIPGSHTCDSAILSLYQDTAGSSATFTLNIYSISIGNEDWIEGVNGWAQALVDEPCWDARQADGAGGVKTAWSGSAGLSTVVVDYEATLLGTMTGERDAAPGTEFLCTFNTPGKSRITDWFDSPNTNYGLKIAQNISTPERISSSENATAANRPKLVIEHSEVSANYDTTPQFFPILFDKKKH
jgi:hypothetical protein